MGIFSTTLKAAENKGINLQRKSSSSLNWFRQYVSKHAPKDVDFARVRRDVREISSHSNLMTKGKNVLPGVMYMFVYDAKHKATLPYWDATPLIFPIDGDSKSFLGINFHYLPLALRAKLMDALYQFQMNPGKTEKAKLQMTYQMLKSAATHKYIKPTIKRYLVSHVRSRLVEIPYEAWEIALFLPTATWQGNAGSGRVYRDSQIIIGRR